MSIQVHYKESDGTTGVINYMSSDNAGANTPAEVQRLRARATQMAGEWGKVFPDTTFFVTENGRRV